MLKEGESLKLLCVTSQYYPDGSGAELSTHLLCRKLAERGVDVQVLARSKSHPVGRVVVDGVNVLNLPTAGWNAFDIYSKSATLLSDESRILRKLLENADIAYIAHSWYAAIPEAVRLKVPVIVHLHGYLPICHWTTLFNYQCLDVCSTYCMTFQSFLGCVVARRRHGVMHWPTSDQLGKFVLQPIELASGYTMLNRRKYLLDKADKIFAVSKYVKDVTARIIPDLEPKLEVLYNQIPQIEWKRHERNERFKIGYFGGPSVEKGFLNVLSAFSKASEHNNLELQLTRVTNNQVPRRVVEILEGRSNVWTSSSLSREQYEKLLSQINVVVVPSIFPEPFGYVVAEPILAGAVVIASRIGGIAEIGENEGLFLVEPNNVDDLAATISMVSEISEEELVERSLRGRGQILRKFDNEREADKFIAACDELT